MNEVKSHSQVRRDAYANIVLEPEDYFDVTTRWGRSKVWRVTHVSVAARRAAYHSKWQKPKFRVQGHNILKSGELRQLRLSSYDSEVLDETVPQPIREALLSALHAEQKAVDAQ